MFSILTPTFNRKKELPRVYSSLRQQTYGDFEWIISDDGSTDGTSQLIEEWQRENLDFKIIYHRLSENKGKSYAVNEGLELCGQPYTIIADSDDTFSDQTLMDLKTIWEGVEKTEDAKNIGALWTLVEDEYGKLVGEPWPKNLWQVSFKERVLNRKHQIIGEKWHCWRTEVLKEFKMYVNPKSFISEAATWNKINDKYDFLCINKVHRRYWHTEEGMIHKKKPYKEAQKVIFYTSFYHLDKASKMEIISTSYYRNIAFKYIQSVFYYYDKNLMLGYKKSLLCFCIFVFRLPYRLMNKIL